MFTDWFKFLLKKKCLFFDVSLISPTHCASRGIEWHGMVCHVMVRFGMVQHMILYCVECKVGYQSVSH